MTKRIALTGILSSLSLLSISCYNNPEVSLKKPGEGPTHLHSRPAVGPGTTAGGSTAGPQPAPEHHGEGNVEPQPGGVHPASAAEGGSAAHSQPATPVHGAGATESPSIGKEQTGNEQGPGRGHETQPSGAAQKHAEQK